MGTIAQLVRRVGLSPRRLIELFTNQAGMTPKRFCRVRRFHHALDRLHASPSRTLHLADLALACGYYDQAHFIRDFKEYSGLTPGEYLDSTNVVY